MKSGKSLFVYLVIIFEKAKSRVGNNAGIIDVLSGRTFDLRLALLDLTCMRLARPDDYPFYDLYHGFCVTAGRHVTKGT